MGLAKVIDYATLKLEDGSIRIRVNFSGIPDRDQIVDQLDLDTGIVFRELVRNDYLSMETGGALKISVAVGSEDNGKTAYVLYETQKPGTERPREHSPDGGIFVNFNKSRYDPRSN